jgi:hypothetical protein
VKGKWRRPTVEQNNNAGQGGEGEGGFTAFPVSAIDGPKEGTYTEGVEENILTKEGWSDWRVEKAA